MLKRSTKFLKKEVYDKTTLFWCTFLFMYEDEEIGKIMKKWGNILLRKKNVERLIIFNNQFLCPTYTNSSKYWSNSGQFTTSSTKVRKNKHTEKSLIFFKKKKIFPIFRSDCWSSRKIKKFLYSRWLLAILRIKKFLIMRVDWLFILPSKLSELHKKRFTSKKNFLYLPWKVTKVSKWK